MPNKKIAKLFAVAALASSAPALASPDHERPVRAEAKDPWDAPAPAPQPGEVTIAPALGSLAQTVLAVLGVFVPRTLTTGAPACGNVNTKSPRRCR